MIGLEIRKETRRKTNLPRLRRSLIVKSTRPRTRTQRVSDQWQQLSGSIASVVGRSLTLSAPRSTKVISRSRPFIHLTRTRTFSFRRCLLDLNYKPNVPY